MVTNSASITITADDCGALACIDDAVLCLLADGLLTEAAAFPNGQTFSNFGINTAGRYAVIPHLTLTFGTPITDPRPLELLLKQTGEFAEPRDYFTGSIEGAIAVWSETHLSRASEKAVEAELEGQLEFFASIHGQASKITMHHDIDIQYHERLGIRGDSILALGRYWRHLQGHTAGTSCGFLPASANLADAEQFVLEAIESSIEKSRRADGQNVEVVFHPSMPSETLPAFTVYTAQRCLEFEALRSAGVRRLLATGARTERGMRF